MRQIRTEPPPSSQPLSATSYWSARARPAGSLGRRLRADRRTPSSRSASSSGTTPLNGLWVASQRPPSASHLYIGKRWTQQYASTFGSARPSRPPSSAAQPAEDVGGRLGLVGDDEDQVARRSAPVASTSRSATSSAEELRDRRVELAVVLRPRGGRGPSPRTASRARSARRSRCGSRRPGPARRSP